MQQMCFMSHNLTSKESKSINKVMGKKTGKGGKPYTCYVLY
jgi:hypothetical protein